MKGCSYIGLPSAQWCPLKSTGQMQCEKFILGTIEKDGTKQASHSGFTKYIGQV